MKTYSDTKPSVLEAVGNGNWLFHYDMVEVPAPTIEGELERTQWEAEEVLIIGEPTENKVTQAVITDAFPTDYEQKLLNEYNAVQLGLLGNKTSDEAKAKVDAYKAFLARRAELKNIVNEALLEKAQTSR